jgi:FMN reductase [NAD(P)H]
MNASKAIELRKSARDYENRTVEKEKIEAIVKAGNSAPIFGQIQITVIENQELLKEINEVTINMMKNSNNDFLVESASMEGYSPLYRAPILILLSSPEGNDSKGINMANVSCAAENILITATELELGSCFVMLPMMAFSNPDLLQKIGVPDKYIPLCGVLIGYAGGEGFTMERVKKENINYCR